MSHMHPARQPKGSIFKEYMSMAYIRQSRPPRYLFPNPLTLTKGALPGLVIGGIWVWFKHYGQDPTPLTKWWAQNIWPAHHLDNVDELTVEYGRPNIVAPGTAPNIAQP